MIPTKRRSTPPCDIILVEYMKPMGMSLADFIEATGLDSRQAGALLGGVERINPYIAKRLAEAFETSEELWINLQRNYDAGKPTKEPTDV